MRTLRASLALSIEDDHSHEALPPHLPDGWNQAGSAVQSEQLLLHALEPPATQRGALTSHTPCSVPEQMVLPSESSVHSHAKDQSTLAEDARGATHVCPHDTSKDLLRAQKWKARCKQMEQKLAAASEQSVAAQTEALTAQLAAAEAEAQQHPARPAATIAALEASLAQAQKAKCRLQHASVQAEEASQHDGACSGFVQHLTQAGSAAAAETSGIELQLQQTNEHAAVQSADPSLISQAATSMAAAGPPVPVQASAAAQSSQHLPHRDTQSAKMEELKRQLTCLRDACKAAKAKLMRRKSQILALQSDLQASKHEAHAARQQLAAFEDAAHAAGVAPSELLTCLQQDVACLRSELSTATCSQAEGGRETEAEAPRVLRTILASVHTEQAEVALVPAGGPLPLAELAWQAEHAVQALQCERDGLAAAMQQLEEERAAAVRACSAAKDASDEANRWAEGAKLAEAAGHAEREALQLRVQELQRQHHADCLVRLLCRHSSLDEPDNWAVSACCCTLVRQFHAAMTRDFKPNRSKATLQSYFHSASGAGAAPCGSNAGKAA